jgi:hypothetical protein
MIVTITFRGCGACRYSKRKIPCHVPNCIWASTIGITSLDRVNTIRDGMKGSALAAFFGAVALLTAHTINVGADLSGIAGAAEI